MALGMGTSSPGRRCWAHRPANCGAKPPGMEPAAAMWAGGSRDTGTWQWVRGCWDVVVGLGMPGWGSGFGVAGTGQWIKWYWDMVVGQGVLGQVGESGSAGMG